MACAGAPEMGTRRPEPSPSVPAQDRLSVWETSKKAPSGVRSACSSASGPPPEPLAQISAPRLEQRLKEAFSDIRS